MTVTVVASLVYNMRMVVRLAESLGPKCEEPT
jgi:hypothetical protein